jgi:hypothetical protein
MGATTTSGDEQNITDFVLVELEFIDDTGDEALSGGEGVVGFPVSADEDFSHVLKDILILSD